MEQKEIHITVAKSAQKKLQISMEIEGEKVIWEEEDEEQVEKKWNKMSKYKMNEVNAPGWKCIYNVLFVAGWLVCHGDLNESTFYATKKRKATLNKNLGNFFFSFY